MEDICLQATDNTPKVILSYNDGLIELEGRSYPENTFEFYAPMMEWIKEYFETSAKELTTVNLEITYFNSSSSKLFFDFFDFKFFFLIKQKNFFIKFIKSCFNIPPGQV